MADLNHSGIITNELRDKNVEFWNRKGVIKMDPKCEERCSHTNIPPSTMMTLAMELLISNRGKASKMFRKGRERAQTPEDNNGSNLAQMWVVPGAESLSRGESPNMASHLKPSLANSDFVFRTPTTPIQKPELKSDKILESSNTNNDLDIFKTFSVADLVGSQDHVISYSDSENENAKPDDEKKNKKQSKRNKQNHLIVDVGSEINCSAANRSSPTYESITPLNQHESNAKVINCEGSSKCNDLLSLEQDLNRFVEMDIPSSKQTISDDITKVPLKDEVNSQVENNTGKLQNFKHSSCTEVVLKNNSNRSKSSDNDFQDQLLTQLTAQLSKDITASDKLDSKKAVRKTSCPLTAKRRIVKETRIRSKSLQPEPKKSDVRTNSPEYTSYNSNPCSPPPPTSSVLSSSLSSSLFSLSSLGSVSSTSLPVSSVTSERPSMASCASLSPDSDFFGGKYSVNKVSRNKEMFNNIKKANSLGQYDDRNTKDFNNNLTSRGSNKITALRSPINRSSGCAVGEVLTSPNSISIGQDSVSNLNTLKHVAKRTTRISSQSSNGSADRSPSRKVIHEYTEVLPETEQCKLKGSVISRAVFPDKDDSTKATPVLHLQNLSKAKSLNNLSSADANMLCCFKTSPKVPVRKESKEAIQLLSGNKTSQKNTKIIEQGSAVANINTSNLEKTENIDQPVSTRCHSRGCTISLSSISSDKSSHLKTEPSKQPKEETVISKQLQKQQSAMLTEDYSLLDEVVQQINDIHPRVRVVNGSKISLLGERFPTAATTSHSQQARPRKNVAIFNQNPLNNRQARVIETLSSQQQSQVCYTQKNNNNCDKSNSIDTATNVPLRNLSSIKDSPEKNDGQLKVSPCILDNKATTNPDYGCNIENNSKLGKKKDQHEIVAVDSNIAFQGKSTTNQGNKSGIENFKTSNTLIVEHKIDEQQQLNPEIVQRSSLCTTTMPSQGAKFSSTMQVSLRAPREPQRQVQCNRVLRRSQSGGPRVKSPNFNEVHPEYRKWVNEWSTSFACYNPVTSDNFRKNVNQFKKLDSETQNLSKQPALRTRSTEAPASLKYNTDLRQTRSTSSASNEGYENGQTKNEGTRKERHVRFLPKMVGNEIETMKPLNSVSPTNNEDDESGVIEPPSMTVKDIRAMFHGGADYKNYAKPRSLSSSSGGSLNRQMNRSKSHSECSNNENVDESKHEVAQQVMSLFQSALDIEKELTVFQDENQNEKTQNVVSQNNGIEKKAPTPPPKPPVSRKPKRLGNGVWPPVKDQNSEVNNNKPAEPIQAPAAKTETPEDIKTSVNKIKSETQNVASFDESLDQFYDVLNDLTS